MSIIVNNTDNQLNINSNGVLDVYAVKSIKSVSRGIDNTGNYYIAINFIANDKNNSLRIYLKDVTSPVTWTNNLTGANAALADIRDWLSEVIEVEISEANDSILIYGYDGANNQPVSVDSNGQVNTNVHDGTGNAITSTTIGSDTALDVNIAGGVTLSVNLDANDDEVSIYGSNGGTPTAVAVNASGQVAVQDGGGSLTVDGTVAATQSGAWSVTNLANSGVDIGDVTINNAAGASAVNIQDGGNSITVDAVNLDIRDLSHLVDTIKIYGSNNANPVSTDVAGNIGIWDGNNSITVDGGTGIQRTPTFLRPTGVSGTVSAGTFSMSFASVGTANATVGSITLKPGETLNFDAGAINNTLGAVSYSTLTAGAELIIITLT